MANSHNLSRFIDDARHILELAVPLALTQLAQVAISTTSIIVLGLLGSVELAAGGLAIGLFNLLRTMGVGLAVGTANLVAEEARSAGDAGKIARYAAASLQISTLAGLAAMAFMTQVEPLLLILGQDAEVARLAGIYLMATSWGILPCLWFNALRSFTVGLRKPGPVLAITLASIAINAALASGLATGRFGLPQIGASGVAIAAALVHLASFAALSAHVLRSPRYRAYRLAPAFLQLDAGAWKRTLALGVPTSATYGSEAAFTVAIALLMGTFGQAALAAHNIVNQIIYIAFMLAVGLSHGTSVAISEAQGQGQGAMKRRYGATGIGIGIAVMSAVGAGYVLLPGVVLAPFASGSGSNAADVMQLVAHLLAIAAVLQLFDCSQNIGVGLMRGIGRARLTLGLTLVGYWLIGLPVAVALSYAIGPTGVWWGLCAGLAATAMLILSSFERLTRLR
ncbi:MATE family efflux transporter [Aminobacter sp. AP02]|uniref:MATE family efflux transporter n=1 Tax=Aminobacter sp. AP02 TaxID=2135737 RepID=UPI000D6AB49E|nr:MATE family efflux transporter [Aminobacter sp. AP02]PWK75542.1 MATE family multidrug resistance protein [Aminobacter sp. AP02]